MKLNKKRIDHNGVGECEYCGIQFSHYHLPEKLPKDFILYTPKKTNSIMTTTKQLEKAIIEIARCLESGEWLGVSGMVGEILSKNEEEKLEDLKDLLKFIQDLESKGYEPANILEMVKDKILFTNL